MAKTRTSGITVDKSGYRTVNKQVLGTTIFQRLGKVSQEEAEKWLAGEVQRIRLSRTGATRPDVPFREAAARYLKENQGLRSREDADWHLGLLTDWIGQMPIADISNDALAAFKEHRLQKNGVSISTLNHSLELVRRILNIAAVEWQHPNRLTWLERAPRIKLEPNPDARPPYPLSWAEQELFFAELPEFNRDMAEFKVNVGLRDFEVCALEWEWETHIVEVDITVFVVPGDLVKNKGARLVVLNRIAAAVIERRRGLHPKFVFAYRGKNVQTMNNTAWQSARRRATAKYLAKFGRNAPSGFSTLHVHDLKHTFGRRLRAAGVQEATRKVLLGHANGDISIHYSAAEIMELVRAANRIDPAHESPVLTLIRVPDRKST